MYIQNETCPRVESREIGTLALYSCRYCIGYDDMYEQANIRTLHVYRVSEQTL